ncbi:hypothetical protein TNCV_3014961 [Trichonephila clavipes]|nr:hypothetical protein TNCV_3014961 [Trichonephila clavipes]
MQPWNSEKGNVKLSSKSSLVQIIQIFQSSSSGSSNSRTVRRELKNLGFHSRVAAHNPNITPQNAKCIMQWCKAVVIGQWTWGKLFFWSDESCFTI